MANEIQIPQQRQETFAFEKNSDAYPLLIQQIFYNTSTRRYEDDGPELTFPAFIKKSQVKFNFKTQQKPYALVQDIPEYVSSIHRSYDLEFEVIGNTKDECIENYKVLHEFLKLMKTTYEKTRNLSLTNLGTAKTSSVKTSWAINNMYINSRANFKISLESNPYVYDSTSSTFGNIYDILLTGFDYKIEDAHGYVDGYATFGNDGDEKKNAKPTLIPVAYSVTLSGLMPPEDPNIAIPFKYKRNETQTTPVANPSQTEQPAKPSAAPSATTAPFKIGPKQRKFLTLLGVTNVKNFKITTPEQLEAAKYLHNILLTPVTPEKVLQDGLKSAPQLIANLKTIFGVK